MVRKFTRPPKALDSIPTTSRAAAAVSTPETTPKSPSKNTTKRRSPQPSTSTSSPANNSDSRTSKRMRLPHRPYQAPDPIPFKILQQIKQEENESKQKVDTAKPGSSKQSKPKSPLKREAPDSPIPPKKKKPDSPPSVPPQKKAAVTVKKEKSAPVKSNVPGTSKSKAKPKPKSGTANTTPSTPVATAPKKRRVSLLVKKPKVAAAKAKSSCVVKLPKKLLKPRVSSNGLPIPVAGSSSTATNDATATATTPKVKKKKKVEKRNDLSAVLFPSIPNSPVVVKKKGTKGKRKKDQNLTPRLNVTEYEKDPMFESNIPIPFISSVVQSKLLIRAVRTGDKKLLEKLLKDKKEIYSFCTPQSLHVDRDASYYAVKTENTEALKLLINEKLAENLSPFPDSIVEEESSGKGSHLMFGHGLRAVTVGRGGKEGNNALTRDTNSQKACSTFPKITTIMNHCMDLGKSISLLSKIIPEDDLKWYKILPNINRAVLAGHTKVAGELVTRAIKDGGYGFNDLHKLALTLSGSQPFPPFKPISVTKKAQGSFRATPIHFAAINPDPSYLAALLSAKPDFSVMDTAQRTPLHYAAVCSGSGPLTFLLSKGLSAELVDKEGKSPLYMAAQAGRATNLEKLFKSVRSTGAASAGEESDGPADIAGPFIDRPCRSTGLSPIHVAAQGGFEETVLVLIRLGANIEKMTPAQFDKLTPLMIAAQFGHLNVVKALVEGGAIIDEKDKKGRTALAHAVIDGHAHVVSYLLRLGADNKVKDTSGNSLVHYAAAYGWYFNWKLLLESGCLPNEPNDWKMTPVAIAFMKGHIGLVEQALLLSQGADAGESSTMNVDINAPVNYSNGMTLLHQTCASEPGEFLLSRIKFLVTKLGADVGALDFEKNNALHFLVQSDGKQVEIRKQRTRWWMDDAKRAAEAKERKKIQECLFSAAKLMLQSNADPLFPNMKAETPVSLAARLGCYELLKIFLTSGKCETLSTPSPSGEETTDPTVNTTTILHNIVADFGSDDGAGDFCKYCASRPPLVVDLKLMARRVNAAGCTPLLLYLQKIQSKETENNNEAADANGTQRKSLDFLKFLILTLDSDVNAVVDDKTKNTALHIVAETKATVCPYIDKVARLILGKKPVNDTLNAKSMTPLMLAVSSLNEEVAKALLNSGSSPNFSTVGDSPKSILIMAAENADTSFNLIPLLVEKGANVRDVNPQTGNSALHLIASKPDKPGAVEAIRKIIASGKVDAYGVNKHGRMALHLAVNARGGETDVSYDVEDLLIELGGRALITPDVRGRLPLHYAFVKIGKHKEANFIDPIELVAILTRAMKDYKFGDKINAADEFGGTPMHYAAQRGATISSSLLISEARNDKSKINPVDANGNTPFGLAVLKGHEGCALYFQQSGGDFMNSVNSKFKVEPSSDEKQWKWKYSAAAEEHEERKLLEQSKYSILQEVVRKDWQGLLHLMLEKLKSFGAGVAPAIEVAIKTNRLKLALKLIHRVKNNKELLNTREQHSLLHTLAKSTEELDVELAKELIKTLIQRGIELNLLDVYKANPIIYAAQNRNANLCLEFGKFMKAGEVAKLPADKFGRSPFSALFWNINGSSVIDSGLKAWAQELLSNGADANVLCHYPITLSTFPVSRTCGARDSSYSNKFSPLTLAVIEGNYEVVAWLLGLNKGGKVKVDPNFPDELGRTPLMHAARMNDVKMVKLLLNPRTYDPTKDKKPWNFNRTVNKVIPPDAAIDLKAQDRNGWTVIHHLVAPLPTNIFYFNSDIILRILASINTPLELKALNKQTPLNLARQRKVYKLATVLQTLLGIHDYSTSSTDEQPNLVIDESGGRVEEVDFASDAKKMVEKLIADHQKLNGIDQEEPPFEPDPLSGFTVENGELVKDETHNMPYDCLLTQVDLAYGIYGLYNFYKMQVIKEKHGKELIILFTRWGRVGDAGQFQKTPFPTAEEATREFRKIFRAKSGNSWENVKEFTNSPKKYRLVKTESRARKNTKDKSAVKVDFVSLEMMALCKGSTLPSNIFELIKILSLVHREKEKAEEARGYDEDYVQDMSYSLMDAETLKRGDSILDEISKLLILKDAARLKMNEDNSPYPNLMNSIIEKSEEFYGLIPVYGFAFEKLAPLFSWDLLRSKQEKIHSLVHLSFANQLMLAAQLGIKEQNPIDYVYKALGTKIELIDKGGEEAQVILQYIEDTSEPGRRHRNSPVVEGIYKVERPGETEKVKDSGIGNKWLLWHGTKTANVLSILHRGLQVVPLGSELCGHMFGKGVYFADTFAKSRNYCFNDHGDCKQNYMFLCEVALGNVQNVDFDDITDEQSALKSSFDSLKTCNARMIPDPGAVIYWNGGIVPLGQRIENIPEKEDEYFSLENNEYIIFNTNQIKLRYLVQFK